jgi:hypothetical protein
MALWTEQRAGGTQGVAGPPGPSSSSTPAPNVTSASVAVSYVLNGNGPQNVVFSGTINLPTSDPQYDHLREIDVYAINAAGVSFQIAALISATVYPATPFSGSTISYTGIVEPQPSSVQTWSVSFVAVNEVGAPTASPVTVTGVGVSPASISALTGVEVGLWAQQAGGQLNAELQANITMAYAGTVSLWTIGSVSGTIFHGWFAAPSGASVILIGAQGDTKTSFPAPTTANDSVQFVAVPGAVFWQSGGVNPTTLTGYFESVAFTVTMPAANSTMASACYADSILYTKTAAQGAYTWSIPNMYATFTRFVSGVANPNWFYGRLYCIQGAGTGAGFVPLASSVDAPISDDATVNSTVQVNQNSIIVQDITNWGVPSDGTNLTFRFHWNCASRQGTPSAAIEVQQNSCWVGGYAGTPYTDGGGNQWYDVVVDGTKSNLTSIDPSLVVVGNVMGGNPALMAGPGENLLVNPGFEAYTVGWTLTDNGMGMHLQSDATVNHTTLGSRCLEVNALVNGALATASQKIVLTSTRQLLLNVWMANDAGAQFSWQLVAYYYDSGGSSTSPPYNVVAGGSTGGVATGWTQYGGVGSPPANAAIILFQLNVTCTGGTGNIHFDDAEAYLLPSVGSASGLYLDAAGAANVAVSGMISILGNAVSVAAAAITGTYLAAASVGATQLAANAISVANATTVVQALALVDSVIATVGLNKLAATTLTQGTAIFTGDAIFSRGSGNPMMILQATSPAGMYLYTVANSGSTAGVTSSPYIAIEAANGILVASNVGGPSVLVTATAQTFYSVNGNLNKGFVQISAAGGITLQSTLIIGGIYNGYYFQTFIDPGSITLSLTNGSAVPASVVLTPATVTITAGLFSQVLTASSLQLEYNGTPYLTLNSSGLAIAAGASITSPSITGGALTISSGSGPTAVTINLDSTNYLKIQNTFSTAYAQVTGGNVYVISSAATTTLSPGTVQCAGGGLTSTLAPDTLTLPGLPSSSPGSGSKKLWYDPSDSNRVKYAP